MKKIEIIYNGETIRILQCSDNFHFRITAYNDGGFEVRKYGIGCESKLVACFSRDYSFISLDGNQGDENIQP